MSRPIRRPRPEGAHLAGIDTSHRRPGPEAGAFRKLHPPFGLAPRSFDMRKSFRERDFHKEFRPGPLLNLHPQGPAPAAALAKTAGPRARRFAAPLPRNRSGAERRGWNRSTRDARKNHVWGARPWTWRALARQKKIALVGPEANSSIAKQSKLCRPSRTRSPEHPRPVFEFIRRLPETRPADPGQNCLLRFAASRRAPAPRSGHKPVFPGGNDCNLFGGAPCATP